MSKLTAIKTKKIIPNKSSQLKKFDIYLYTFVLLTPYYIIFIFLETC